MQQNIPQPPLTTHSEINQDIIQNCYQQQQQSLNLSWKIDQWVAILQARDWSKLRQIIMKNCGIGDSNVGVIVDRDWLTLEVLEISENKIQFNAIATLIKNAWPQLKQLKIDTNFLQDEGFHILISWPKIATLTKLLIDKNNFSWRGMSLMPQLQANNLTILTLNYNKIGSRGIKLLIKSELKQLSKLELYKCEIQAEGVKHLNKSNWANLKHLNINDNYLVGEGHSILHTNNWVKLTFISIWEANPIQILKFVAFKWAKGVSIDKDVYELQFKKTINKILKSRYLK